jgi:hypothetical protein
MHMGSVLLGGACGVLERPLMVLVPLNQCNDGQWQTFPVANMLVATRFCSISLHLQHTGAQIQVLRNSIVMVIHQKTIYCIRGESLQPFAIESHFCLQSPQMPANCAI